MTLDQDADDLAAGRAFLEDPRVVRMLDNFSAAVNEVMVTGRPPEDVAFDYDVRLESLLKVVASLRATQ